MEVAAITGALSILTALLGRVSKFVDENIFNNGVLGILKKNSTMNSTIFNNAKKFFFHFLPNWVR